MFHNRFYGIARTGGLVDTRRREGGGDESPVEYDGKHTHFSEDSLHGTHKPFFHFNHSIMSAHARTIASNVIRICGIAIIE